MNSRGEHRQQQADEDLPVGVDVAEETARGGREDLFRLLCDVSLPVTEPEHNWWACRHRQQAVLCLGRWRMPPRRCFGRCCRSCRRVLMSSSPSEKWRGLQAGKPEFLRFGKIAHLCVLTLPWISLSQFRPGTRLYRSSSGMDRFSSHVSIYIQNYIVTNWYIV